MKKILTSLCLCALLTTTAHTREVSIETKIQGLYIAYFKRAGDKEGVEYWKNRAVESTNNSAVLKELSAGFSAHPVFSSTYGNLSNRVFVEEIYKNVLGNVWDSEGIKFWTSLLDKEGNRSDMLSEFVESSLTADLTAEVFPALSTEELATAKKRQDLITNKALVANNFTTLLGDNSNVVNSSDPENDPAYIASIKILEKVTEDETTSSTEIEYLLSVRNGDDPISEINNSHNDNKGGDDKDGDDKDGDDKSGDDNKG